MAGDHDRRLTIRSFRIVQREGIRREAAVLRRITGPQAYRLLDPRRNKDLSDAKASVDAVLATGGSTW